MRLTVVRLIGLPNSPRAAPARSPSDWRLRGTWVRATRSQARAATTARSRGGKSGRTPTTGLILQGELPVGPALAPEADGVGVEFDPKAGRDVRDQGILVQQQDQARPLPEVSGRG